MAFSGRRVPRVPRTVSWILTLECDHRCKHCYVEAGTRTPGELSPAARRSVLLGLVRAGVRFVIFSGGDPLRCSDLPDLLELARSLNLAVIPPIPAQGFGDRETWSERLYQAGFPQPRLAREMATATFPSVKEFLKALQATGATNPRPGRFSPRLLQALMAAYETDYGRDGDIPVSYEMIWAVADKS